jgi:hypothetical protein
VAAILTDESRFLIRVWSLQAEAVLVGDETLVYLCRGAREGDDEAREACAWILAEAEAEEP